METEDDFWDVLDDAENEIKKWPKWEVELNLRALGIIRDGEEDE